MKAMRAKSAAWGISVALGLATLVPMVFYWPAVLLAFTPLALMMCDNATLGRCFYGLSLIYAAPMLALCSCIVCGMLLAEGNQRASIITAACFCGGSWLYTLPLWAGRL